MNSFPVSDPLEASGDIQGIACRGTDGPESDSTLSTFVADAMEGSFNCSTWEVAGSSYVIKIIIITVLNSVLLYSQLLL